LAASRFDSPNSRQQGLPRGDGDQVPRGLKTLYEDPELKFQIPRTSTTRHHVATARSRRVLAIHGQPQSIPMIEWEREDDGSDPKHAKLTPEKKYG
jgi:hypothetical protein